MNKKKIALVVDVPDWAFDIEARLLKKKLGKYYDIDIFVSASPRYNNDLYLVLKDTENYDIIHVFFRKLIIQIESDDFKKHFTNEEEYNSFVAKISQKLSTGIYDHLFVDEENALEYQNIFKKYIKMYYTCSKRLENIYHTLHDKYGYPIPYGTIYDAFDGTIFHDNPKRTFDKTLTIGWVGNSKWNIKYQDFKGFNTIIKPIIEELNNEGYDITTNYADKNIRQRSSDEMPEYYDSIDICLIASSSEGTPRPLFEAMASGVVVIATDVGIVPEVLGPLGQSCIVGNRDLLGDDTIKQNMKNKIIELYNNRQLLKDISKENITYGSKCDINNTYLEYKAYFDAFLSR